MLVICMNIAHISILYFIHMKTLVQCGISNHVIINYELQFLPSGSKQSTDIVIQTSPLQL